MSGVRNGLYSIHTEMTDGGRGRANGVIVLRDGRIAGGDSHFYYTGSYTAKDGKWRGELTTNEHTKSVGVLPLFGGREVTSRLHRHLCGRRSGSERHGAGRQDQRDVPRQAEVSLGAVSCCRRTAECLASRVSAIQGSANAPTPATGLRRLRISNGPAL